MDNDKKAEPNDVPSGGTISKRQFLKRGLRGAGLSVASWYLIPAVETLLIPKTANAQGSCDPTCQPSDHCTPLIEDCTPVFG